MKNADPNRDFDALLEELHQAIVSEKAAVGLVETAQPEDTDVSLKLEEAAECLRLIERVRQRNTRTSDPLEAETPQRIGRFEIEEQIGEGSYGLVYRAYDPDLNRRVAIKVPRPEVALSPKLRDRFVREAEVAASLQHRAIVRVLQAGRAGGTQFISTELCSGPSLAEWIREHAGAVEADHAAKLMLVLSDAVHHAHCRGVLHRDLKPGNVILNPSGPDANQTGSDTLAHAAQITDFGLALALNANTRDTQSGAIVGTPAYMSPEQADGRIEDASSASDVYSLGAILYELLTGAPPFQEATVLATLQAVRATDPKPPSRVVPTVPLDMESICLKCLRKDPADRYPSAAALADDLRGFLERRPISARPLGTLERIRRWTNRNPLPAALGSALAVSIVVGVALFAIQFVETREANNKLKKSNAAMQVARDEAEEAARLEAIVTEFMNRSFVRTSPMAAGKELKVVDMLARTRQELDEAHEMGPISRGAIYVAVARAYWGLGRYAEARDAVDQAIGILPAGHEKRLTARWVLGETHHDDSNPREAIGTLEPLLADARRILGPDHKLVVKCTGTLADAYTTQNRFAEAKQLLTGLPADAPIPPPLKIANAVSRAKIMAATNEREQAIALLLETLESARVLKTSRDFEVARVLGTLGHAYLTEGNGEEAKKHLTENLEVRERLFGSNHKDTLGALNDLAGAYFVCKDLGGAAEYLNRAFEVAQVVLGDDHPDTMGMRYNVAVLHLKSDRADKAVPLFREVHRWRKGQPGVDLKSVHQVARRLAAALEANGETEEADRVRSEIEEESPDGS